VASAVLLAAESVPAAAAASSLAETRLRIQQQRSNPVALQPPVQRKQVSPAADSGPDAIPVFSQSQGRSHLVNQTADTGSRGAGYDISARGALAVMGGLAEIREMKADSLERSLERESVMSIIALI
jgi:hypothetical protein